MNLTKYFLTTAPLDTTLGPTDMPSIWNLKKYKSDPGTQLNLAGDSWRRRLRHHRLRPRPRPRAAAQNEASSIRSHWLNRLSHE